MRHQTSTNKLFYVPFVSLFLYAIVLDEVEVQELSSIYVGSNYRKIITFFAFLTNAY